MKRISGSATRLDCAPAGTREVVFPSACADGLAVTDPWLAQGTAVSRPSGAQTFDFTPAAYRWDDSQIWPDCTD